MKSMKTLLVAAMLMFTVSASAQATYTDTEGAVYIFQKHWFLELEGGAQYTLGETKFRRLLSPNAQLGIGYQLIRLLACAFRLMPGSRRAVGMVMYP